MEETIAAELAEKLPQEESRDYSYPEPENSDEHFVDHLLPEDGAFEYDGTHLYFTIGSTRNTII